MLNKQRETVVQRFLHGTDRGGNPTQAGGASFQHCGSRGGPSSPGLSGHRARAQKNHKIARERFDTTPAQPMRSKGSRLLGIPSSFSALCSLRIVSSHSSELLFPSVARAPPSLAPQRATRLLQNVSVPDCSRQPLDETPEYHYFMRQSPQAGRVAPLQRAPVHEFYVYRAAADHQLGRYPFGDANAGNMDGVIWYLMNEIVTNYTQGPRCPRRFDISKVHRFKVKMRATPELAAAGMNFGARFAYDSGRCQGRCFPGNVCTGVGDCMAQYDRYGFVPGCNTFRSEYPFPVDANAAPGGVWYSLPLDGRCSGVPTGAKDCTWSYDYAGSITLESLEELAPGNDNCCNGQCSDFWADQWDPTVMSWRVNTALWMFRRPPSCVSLGVEVRVPLSRVRA